MQARTNITKNLKTIGVAKHENTSTSVWTGCSCT